MRVVECLAWYQEQPAELRHELAEKAREYARVFLEQFFERPPTLPADVLEQHDLLLAEIGTWSVHEMTQAQQDGLNARAYVGALVLAIRQHLDLPPVDQPS